MTNTAIPAALVASVFGRAGAITAQSGDYTTTQVTEGTNLYYTQSRFDTAFGLKSTTNLTEGTNLYYSDARARLSLSASGPLAYNNTTGAFTIGQATTGTNGYLSSTDWNTFNNKLSNSLTNGNIWIGNASNIPTAQTLSGDATLSNAGLFTIGVGAVTSTKILNGTLLFADFATNGCLTGEIFKYNGAAWACGIDTTGVTLAIGTLDSVAKSANGAVISGSNLILQTADATNPGIVSTTAQTFAGNKTFDGGVNLGVSTLEGAGLTSCNSITDKLAYNSTTKKFECGADAGNNNIVQRMLTDVTSVSTTLVNLNDLTINIAANEKWVIQYNLHVISPTAADMKFAVTAPAGAACKFSAYDAEGATAQANLGCGVATGLIAGSGLDDPYQAFATIVNGATAGTVTLQWSQFAVSGTSIARAGSTVLAYKVTGADLAEVYYAQDGTVAEGDIVSLTGDGVSQIRKSTKAYDTKSLGIVSTKPGLVIGEADGEGKSVIVGLSGRVPVKISTKNGDIRPGDYITTSDIPGVGMKATRAGHAIGKALTGFAGGSEGTVMVFIQNTYFDGVYDDVITATGTLTTDGTSTAPTPTYSVPGSTLVSSPVITTSTTTPPVLVPVSQSVAESNTDYLEALTNTARDVRETIIRAIMT